jgi:hypothetical protein
MTTRRGDPSLSLSHSLSVPSSLLNQPFHPTLRGLTLTTVVYVHTRDGSDVSLSLSLCVNEAFAHKKRKKNLEKKGHFIFHSFFFEWELPPHPLVPPNFKMAIAYTY